MALALAGLVMPSVASAVIAIDDFAPGMVALSADSGTPVVSNVQSGLLGVIGGSRETMVTWQSGQLNATANNNPPIGTLGLSSSTGVTAMFDLHYDNSGLGLGGVDMTEAGDNLGISMVFTMADAGAATTVTLTDTAGDTLDLTINTVAGPGALFFSFANFVGIGDITDIDQIHFNIQGQVDGDYQIDLITTTRGVPEPITATLGTLSIGALAYGLRRRRIA